MIPIGDRAAMPLAEAEQDGELMMWVEHDPSCVTTGDFAIRVDIFGIGHTCIQQANIWEQ